MNKSIKQINAKHGQRQNWILDYYVNFKIHYQRESL